MRVQWSYTGTDSGQEYSDGFTVIFWFLNMTHLLNVIAILDKSITPVNLLSDGTLYENFS